MRGTKRLVVRKRLREGEDLGDEQGERGVVREGGQVNHVKTSESTRGAESLLERSQASHRLATLLVVEDQMPARRLLCRALAPRYRVLEAADADSAIEIVEKEPVALVLLDLHLPPLADSPREGIRAHRAIREKVPHLPIVVVSADTNPELRAELLRLGAREFIAKPFDPPAIVELVRALLET